VSDGLNVTNSPEEIRRITGIDMRNPILIENDFNVICETIKDDFSIVKQIGLTEEAEIYNCRQQQQGADYSKSVKKEDF